MAGDTDYKRKFNEQNYDRLAITVPKGKKGIIADAAKQHGKSLNKFVNEAIDEKLDAAKRKQAKESEGFSPY